MNYLWGGMILIGIIYGTVTGHLEEVSEAVSYTHLTLPTT